MTEVITPDQAKRLIDDAPLGFLIIGEFKQIPALGDVSEEDLKVKLQMSTYHFEDI